MYYKIFNYFREKFSYFRVSRGRFGWQTQAHDEQNAIEVYEDIYCNERVCAWLEDDWRRVCELAASLPSTRFYSGIDGRDC